MTEIQVGICIGDDCYRERFSNYLMTHYRKQFQIHVFSTCEILLGDIPDHFQVLIASDLEEKRKELADAMKKHGTILIYLQENAEDQEPEEEVCFTEKYQDVEHIIEKIYERLSEKQPVISPKRNSGEKKTVLAVCSLTECALQLPYAIALSDIAAEKKKVLFLDLQGNNTDYTDYSIQGKQNLEDLLVMAEGGRFSYSRMKSCIGKGAGVEFVYLPADSGYLNECRAETISGLLQMLLKETDYEVLVLNLDSGMKGFLQILGQCTAIYMIHAAGMPGSWRYRNFLHDLQEKGIPGPDLLIRSEEVQVSGYEDADCRTLITGWMWDENGNRIRRNLQEVMDFE